MLILFLFCLVLFGGFQIYGALHSKQYYETEERKGSFWKEASGNCEGGTKKRTRVGRSEFTVKKMCVRISQSGKLLPSEKKDPLRSHP
jgi:hypothetical protein